MVIREGGKFLPYRDSSRPERGFKNLKTCPPLIAALPWLDSAMATWVAAINAAGTGLFSVACGSLGTCLERGNRHSGYVEFALNSQVAVRDAANYFPIFLLFNRWLHFHRFVRASFEWELEEAEFIEVGLSGFTCAVYVKTDFVESAIVAQDDWTQALSILGHHLGSQRGHEDDPIYEAALAASSHAVLAASLGPSALNGNGKATA
jgi:hypothetical protein